MSKTRNLSDLLDANGDVKSTALDNVPASDLVNDTTPQLGGDLDTNGHNINLVDADTINIGSSNDLQIKHTGTNSLIADTGTGNLIIRANDLRMQSYALENTYINASEGGSVDLYHNNSKKLETTSAGVFVTGNISTADNGKFISGTSADLQIFHDGSNSYIIDNGTGDLIIRGVNLNLQSTSGEDYINCTNNGGVTLRYDNSGKLNTTSTGVNVTGTLTATAFSGDGSALTNLSAGKIGQVVQTVKGNVSSTSSGTYSQISGLTATITPASASSKVLVKIAMQIGQSNSTTATFKAYRGSTIIGIGDADGSRQRVSTRVSPSNVHWMFPVYYEYLDSPSTSSAVTYSMYWSSGDFTYINRTHSNGNDTSRDQAKPISTITLMEILP